MLSKLIHSALELWCLPFVVTESSVRIPLMLTYEAYDDSLLFVIPIERNANGFLWPLAGPASHVFTNPVGLAVPYTCIPRLMFSDRVFFLTSAK